MLSNVVLIKEDGLVRKLVWDASEFPSSSQLYDIEDQKVDGVYR